MALAGATCQADSVRWNRMDARSGPSGQMAWARSNSRIAFGNSSWASASAAASRSSGGAQDSAIPPAAAMCSATVAGCAPLSCSSTAARPCSRARSSAETSLPSAVCILGWRKPGPASRPAWVSSWMCRVGGSVLFRSSSTVSASGPSTARCRARSAAGALTRWTQSTTAESNTSPATGRNAAASTPSRALLVSSISACVSSGLPPLAAWNSSAPASSAGTPSRSVSSSRMSPAVSGPTRS